MQVRDVIKKGDVDKDGQLDFDEFVKAIKADQESKAEGLTCGTILETIFLVVVTSLFEMGTSFSLPAAGARFALFCVLLGLLESGPWVFLSWAWGWAGRWILLSWVLFSLVGSRPRS